MTCVNLFSDDLSNQKLDGQCFTSVGNMDKVNLSGASLRGADLTGVSLRGANLSKANLCGANLGGADLSGANLDGANLTGANLHYTKLDGCDLRNAYLEKAANLTGASLKGCNLRYLYLDDIDLNGCNLTNADLSNTYLIGTSLKGCNLRGTNLTNARVSSYCMYDKVTFSVGDYIEPTQEYFINIDGEGPRPRKGVLCFTQGATTYYLVGMHRTRTDTYAYWNVMPYDTVSIFDMVKVYANVIPYDTVSIFDMVKVYAADCTTLQVSIGEVTPIKTSIPHEELSAMLNSQGIIINAGGVQYMDGRMVTPHDILPKPTVKKQTPQEWAFKMGTLKPAGTEPPCWKDVLSYRHHQYWGVDAICPSIITHLDKAYSLGTHCKWGTTLDAVCDMRQHSLHNVMPPVRQEPLKNSCVPRSTI